LGVLKAPPTAKMPRIIIRLQKQEQTKTTYKLIAYMKNDKIMHYILRKNDKINVAKIIPKTHCKGVKFEEGELVDFDDESFATGICIKIKYKSKNPESIMYYKDICHRFDDHVTTTRSYTRAVCNNWQYEEKPYVEPTMCDYDW